MPAEDRPRGGESAAGYQRRPCRCGVDVGGHHHEAGYILPGHGHDEQGQPKAHDDERIKHRRNEGQLGAMVALCNQPVPADRAITMVAVSMAAGTAQRGARR